VAALPLPTPSSVDQLAGLGITFLMFLIGLELSLQRAWALRRWVLGAGIAQVVFTALAIALFAQAFGNPVRVALLVGLVLSLSSTAMVIQLLAQRQALGGPMGQAILAILLLQDLAVIPALILVDTLADPTAAGWPGLMLVTLLKSMLAIGMILVVGKPLVAPVFRQLTHQRQPEVFMALTLLTVLGVAALTEAAGLSMALGALLAGILLADTEFAHEVQITIEPFKGLLMGLFFMSVGMQINPWELLLEPLWLPLATLGRGVALTAGILISQGGEFAFVILGRATSQGLLDAETTQFMLATVSLSLLATPLCDRLGVALGTWLNTRDTLAADGERRSQTGRPNQDSRPDAIERRHQSLSNHVLIAGCGRSGQRIAAIVAQHGIALVAIDHDAHRVASLRAQGLSVIYGNASRPELLQRLAVAKASLFVVTLDEPRAAIHAVRAARRAHPELAILARARDEIHASELRAAGANMVLAEMLETNLQIAATVLRQLGMPESTVQTMLNAERQGP
jgi:CPA2 family monovalent cation:H+ antiporter-2